MMGLFSRKKNDPQPLVPEPLPVISDGDLADAERIMGQWDASMGNSDAMWDCMELIARRGGFRGAEASLRETGSGRDTNDVLQRPWRWWNEAARAANSRGRDALTGRIFLFTHLFATQFAPKMDAMSQLDTGLVTPPGQHYRDIAALALDSLVKLDPGFLIHDTATGRVDVASAIGMAEQVSGARAPSSVTGPSPTTPPVSGDGGQWNAL
jgi:hypothetical protein